MVIVKILLTIGENLDKYYIDIHDNTTFLDDKKNFIWTSSTSTKLLTKPKTAEVSTPLELILGFLLKAKYER